MPSEFRQGLIARLGIAQLARVALLTGFGLALLFPAVQGAHAAQMVGPMRFVSTPGGLVVGDYVGSQVLIVDPTTLQITATIPIYTDSTLLLRGKPLSVGYLNGRLLVGEERTGLIQVFEYVGSGKTNTRNDTNLKKWAGWALVSPSLTAAPIEQASAIVADASLGHLFVASKVQKAVLVLDSAGNLIRTIGGPGSAVPLHNPQAIALDAAGGRVFVTDDSYTTSSWSGETMYAAVQVYDYTGQWLAKIDGSTGAGNSTFRFARAQGVARDGGGRVYVADSYRHEVLVFAEPTRNSFSALVKLGGKGAEPGKLLLPTGVCIDTAASKVYVANTMLSRIEVFNTVVAP